MVADHYRSILPNQHPWAAPGPVRIYPTNEEFDALRKQVEDLKQLIDKAKEYDQRTGQPDCEMDEKLELLRSIALKVGVIL
jgi:hypothetical protein